MTQGVASEPPRRPTAPAWPALGGALAGPLFTASFLLQAPARAGYSSLRHPVSTLALGEHGWLQVATFLISGLLVTGFAGGLWAHSRRGGGSRWGPLLIGAVGIGLIGAGLFPADPLSGYPLGVPDRPAAPTPFGLLHELFSTPVFVGLPAACVVYGRQFAQAGARGWARYSVASGVGMFAAFAAAAVGFAQVDGIVAYGGLLQRLALGIGFSWLSLLALHVSPRDQRAQAQQEEDRRGIDGARPELDHRQVSDESGGTCR